ncbi:MFS transporter [Comamonas serinivorans]|uniref:MFS transporter n=1 Tax=Comamonas serinivorans TaxID=1082851 RepID=A0A1Y0EM71_9BURK|nr:MFS transporter [Comamonas serinivorans]ARU04508.1 MFS transporter [Comamonas serinivorans]
MSAADSPARPASDAAAPARAAGPDAGPPEGAALKTSGASAPGAPAGGAATSSGVPALAVAALSFAAFLSGTSLRLTDALLPRLGGEFGMDLAQVARVVTLFAVAYGVAQLLFGPLGDRFGKYRVVAWACVASVLTTLSCALAPGFQTLALGRLLAGATTAAIIPLSMAWIGDNVPYEQRQPVLARFLLGQILGVSAGVWLGGFAADHLSWRTPFVLIAACFALASVLLFWQHRRLRPQAPVASEAQGFVVARMAREFGQVLAKPWARVVLLAVFLEGACLYGVFAFVATHLHHTFGLSLSTAGSMVMLFGFGGVLYAVASPWLVPRLGEVGLIRVGGVLMAVSLGLVALAPLWWWAMPACFVTGLGFYMMHNTLQINATQMAPERRGAAVSAFASCFFMGQALGVATAGRLVAQWGSAQVMLAGATGVLGVSLLFAWRRARRGPA